MKNSIYSFLNKNRNKKILKDSDEILFYNKNKHHLTNNKYFSAYLDIDNIFDVIKANIIIKSLINKKTIENIIEDEFFINKNFNSFEVIDKNIKEKISDLPHLVNSSGQKIYISFFTEATNYLYTDNYSFLVKEPYDDLKKKYCNYLINPFEIYKSSLYDSSFTKLIKISEDDTSVFFFHYSLNVVFIISKQGYLDNYFILFDKYLTKPNKEKIIERVRNSSKFYFENNLDSFLYSLYNNKLISLTMYNKLCKIKRI